MQFCAIVNIKFINSRAIGDSHKNQIIAAILSAYKALQWPRLCSTKIKFIKKQSKLLVFFSSSEIFKLSQSLIFKYLLDFFVRNRIFITFVINRKKLNCCVYNFDKRYNSCSSRFAFSFRDNTQADFINIVA